MAVYSINVMTEKRQLVVYPSEPPESVDQALCFGWIDGLRKGIDAQSYKIRFTPRRFTSVWSAINTRRMEELIRQLQELKLEMALYADVELTIRLDD